MTGKDDLRILFMNMDAPTAGMLYDQLVSAIGKDSLQSMFSKAKIPPSWSTGNP